MSSRITRSVLLLLLLTGGIYVVVRQFGLFRMAEAGFGDSYILYDVQHFNSTGQIYRDLSAPPYLPAQYGPLVYRLYALAADARIENPFLGPRFVALAAFCLSVSMAAIVAQALIPIRAVWIWALFFAISIRSLGNWPIQLRGDFMGIFLSLAAIRLLLLQPRKAVMAAGICAGLAIQFKITYLAAAVSGGLCLLFQKRWRELEIFAAAALLFSAGIFVLFWLREPRMVAQMTALAPGVRDIHGCLLLLLRAIQEPIVLLALPTLPMVLTRRWPGLNLLLLYALTAWAIGVVTDVQAGGNINYFFEGLFALIPFSVLGSFHLINWSRDATIATFVAGVILIQFWAPEVRDVYEFRSYVNPRTIHAQNDQFRRAEAALHGQSMFSTVPRIALLDPHPPLVEPNLFTYLQRLGKINPKPILERVRSGEFDVIIAGDYSNEWRGIPKVEPRLGTAIVEAYRPYCKIQLDQALFVFLPRHRAEDSILVQKLAQIPCTEYRRAGDALW